MRRALVLIAALALLAGTASAAPEGRFIVSFSGDLPAAAEQRIDVTHRYDAVDAVAGTLPVADAVALAALPGVTVERDTRVHALDEVRWNLDGTYGVRAPAAWNVTAANGTSVAVLDTGIDTDHPELADDISDCDSFVDYTASCEDDNGHGTHVSGIVTAALDGAGVAGTMHAAEVDANKVLDGSGSGYWSDVIAAIDDTVQEGDDAVISMSLGANRAPDALHDAVRRAHSAGIVLVAAAGNDGKGQPSYPARYDEVIAVGASTRDGRIASFSNGKPEVVAPGVSIYSTVIDGYATYDGTSMAAPHVSAAVAGMRTAGSPTVAETRDVLAATARDIAKKDDGNGLIDAGAAVSCVADGLACLSSGGGGDGGDGGDGGGGGGCPPGNPDHPKCG